MKRAAARHPRSVLHRTITHHHRPREVRTHTHKARLKVKIKRITNPIYKRRG